MIDIIIADNKATLALLAEEDEARYTEAVELGVLAI